MQSCDEPTSLPAWYTGASALGERMTSRHVLDHTFCGEHSGLGKFLQHELKPNGRNIPVTEENKKEYVRLYVNWRFMRGMEAQFLALQKGFSELVPQHLLKPFDHKELEAQ